MMKIEEKKQHEAPQWVVIAQMVVKIASYVLAMLAGSGISNL